jgi:hypothetical protein
LFGSVLQEFATRAVTVGACAPGVVAVDCTKLMLATTLINTAAAAQVSWRRKAEM